MSFVIKMMESLSEDLQHKVAEHLREYLADLQDELTGCCIIISYLQRLNFYFCFCLNFCFNLSLNYWGINGNISLYSFKTHD